MERISLPLVEIELTDLPKSGGGATPALPSSDIPSFVIGYIAIAFRTWRVNHDAYPEMVSGFA